MWAEEVSVGRLPCFPCSGDSLPLLACAILCAVAGEMGRDDDGLYGRRNRGELKFRNDER